MRTAIDELESVEKGLLPCGHHPRYSQQMSPPPTDSRFCLACEVERTSAENAKLREALRKIAEYPTNEQLGGMEILATLFSFQDHARAALAE